MEQKEDDSFTKVEKEIIRKETEKDMKMTDDFSERIIKSLKQTWIIRLLKWICKK